MAIFMAGPLTFLTYLFRPLSTLLIRSTSLISKRMAKKDGLSMDQLSKALELTEDAEINDEKDILEVQQYRCHRYHPSPHQHYSPGYRR